ncbi:MAG: hypothetical protein AAGG80_03975 [Pseudomonadota bacterium]
MQDKEKFEGGDIENNKTQPQPQPQPQPSTPLIPAQTVTKENTNRCYPALGVIIGAACFTCIAVYFLIDYFLSHKSPGTTFTNSTSTPPFLSLWNATGPQGLEHSTLYNNATVIPGRLG